MDSCRAQAQGSAAWDEVFGNGLRVDRGIVRNRKSCTIGKLALLKIAMAPFHSVRRLLLWGLETVAPLDWALESVCAPRLWCFDLPDGVAARTSSWVVK